jgi:hypothetical protein
MVLAPPEMAIPMAGLIGAPSQVAVRSHHLAYLSAQWGQEETKRRNRLFNIVQGKLNTPEGIEWAKKQLDASSINRIFLAKDHPEVDPFRKTLEGLNLHHTALGDWEIWLLHDTQEEFMRLQTCLKQTENVK